jgi:hypothetical protein
MEGLCDGRNGLAAGLFTPVQLASGKRSIFDTRLFVARYVLAQQGLEVRDALRGW